MNNEQMKQVIQPLLIDEQSNYIFDVMHKNPKGAVRAGILGKIQEKYKYPLANDGIWRYNPQSIGGQYFDLPQIKPYKREVFIDAGAFVGDSFEPFLAWVKHNNFRFISFEPFPECFTTLKNHVKAGNPNCEKYNWGLSNKKQQVKFVSHKHGSSRVTLSKKPTMVLEFTSIDTFAPEYVKEPITFIKMDIEGSEAAALKGAKNTIKKDIPKLAICIYHKYADYVRLPMYIHSLGLGYKFAIRHYSTCEYETVLYAIPPRDQ